MPRFERTGATPDQRLRTGRIGAGSFGRAA
jgi:hypothetical protein